MKAEAFNPAGSRRPKQIEIENEESSESFGAVREALGTVLALLQSRAELFAIELREEKQRAVSIVGWGVGLVFLSFMAMVTIMAAVVFFLWDNALIVLTGFSAFFLVAAVASFFAMRAKLRKIPFGDTVAQLEKDREMVLREF